MEAVIDGWGRIWVPAGVRDLYERDEFEEDYFSLDEIKELTGGYEFISANLAYMINRLEARVEALEERIEP